MKPTRTVPSRNEPDRASGADNTSQDDSNEDGQSFHIEASDFCLFSVNGRRLSEMFFAKIIFFTPCPSALENPSHRDLHHATRILAAHHASVPSVLLVSGHCASCASISPRPAGRRRNRRLSVPRVDQRSSPTGASEAAAGDAGPSSGGSILCRC